MVNAAHGEGTLCVPEALKWTLVGLAERHAEATGEYLRAIGFRGNLPGSFLAELAAVLQLRQWETRGILNPPDFDLPSWREAADDLFARAAERPEEFLRPTMPSLLRHVLKVWVEHFAWEAPDLLQAELMLGDLDEDGVVDALAELFWAHRQDLGRLLQVTENET